MATPGFKKLTDTDALKPLKKSKNGFLATPNRLCRDVCFYKSAPVH